MTSKICKTCHKQDTFTLDTYKRFWHCCRVCGTAVSEQKTFYPLAILPYADLKKKKELDEEKMYDYFIERPHIEWSEHEGQEFITDYLRPSGVDVSDKDLLDISGGNGHFIKQIAKIGAARITLTEINKKTIEYIRQNHNFEVLEYNLNQHDLPTVTGRRFDIIFARACIMFAKDIGKFADEIKRSLVPGGIVMINHSVIPTLGVMLRTQFDEFSYFVLRWPQTIIDEFCKHGLELRYQANETDSSLYVYDNDLLFRWRLIHRFYECRNLAKLISNRTFAWPARDRRRSTLVFRLSSQGNTGPNVS